MKVNHQQAPSNHALLPDKAPPAKSSALNVDLCRICFKRPIVLVGRGVCDHPSCVVAVCELS